jgi:hypothetical protein
MSEPLLLTKLYIPPPRSKVVLRPLLVERLIEGLFSSRKLTLISASAGFGKTTLVSEWIASCQQPVAWLSLDEADNDPTLFLTYLVTALQTITPKIGAGVLAALQSPQPPSVESLLTALHNEIVTLPDNFILVLDDYHVIDSPPVDQVHLQRQVLDILRIQWTACSGISGRLRPDYADCRISVISALFLAPVQYKLLGLSKDIWLPNFERTCTALEDLNCIEVAN